MTTTRPRTKTVTERQVAALFATDEEEPAVEEKPATRKRLGNTDPGERESSSRFKSATELQADRLLGN